MFKLSSKCQVHGLCQCDDSNTLKTLQLCHKSKILDELNYRLTCKSIVGYNS